MSDFDSTPVLLPWWRQSKKIIPVTVLALLLGPAVILVGKRQLSPKASGAISIQVSPGAVDQSSAPQIGQPVYLSATAVNEIGQPITTGVTYTWGISSNFSISPTFKPSNNLATFTPNSTGSGSLWVSAITSQSSAIKYLDICIGVLCPSYTNPTPTPTPIVGTTKVLVLEFNPIIENQNNQRLSVYKGWGNPIALENQYMSDVSAVSSGNMAYKIVDRIIIDGFPVKQDGFSYSDDSYLACLTSNTCHQPDWANYLKILSDYRVCDRVNSGEIDELWLWGGPWFGYYEAIMTGPGAFWTNGGPLTGSTCQKKLNIMGFSYERGVPEMLEDIGHRVEGTMKQVYGSWTAGSDSHAWNKYTLLDKDAPGKAGCGNVHYAPNSMADYDWGNTRTVASNCEDWLNYPNLTGSTQQISCPTWGCEGYGYKKWWLSHLPKAVGIAPDGKLANWWEYVRDYDSAIAITTTPTPIPVSFSNLSASLPKSGPAIFNFSYAGPGQTGFAIDISTTSDMSTDVYFNFAQGANSPLIETNPTKWDKVTCGRTLYWVVRAVSGDKSTIQSVMVFCPSSTPTPTPTPTPKPTTFPTPTPTPIPNTPPTITTQSFPIGFVGRTYSTSIIATDPNLYDNLTAQVTGLPPLLKVTGCIQSTSMPNSYSAIQPFSIRNLVCTIAGTPRRFGIYPVNIIVIDSANASAIKTINLPIFKKYLLF